MFNLNKSYFRFQRKHIFSSGGPKRTGVMVEFSDLAYHFRTPGDFTTEELDSILQFMHERVQRQEKSEIRNLSNLYQALKR